MSEYAGVTNGEKDGGSFLSPWKNSGMQSHRLVGNALIDIIWGRLR